MTFKDQLIASIVCKRWHSIVFNSKTRIRFSVCLKQSDEEFDENMIKEMRNENQRQYEKALNVLSNSYTPVYHLLLQSIHLDFNTCLHVNQWQGLGLSLKGIELIDCTINDLNLFQMISQMNCLFELHLNNNHYFLKQNKTFCLKFN